MNKKYIFFVGVKAELRFCLDGCSGGCLEVFEVSLVCGVCPVALEFGNTHARVQEGSS